MSANVVQFAYREGVPLESRIPNNMSGRAEIFNKLRERGLRPIVTEWAEDAFSAEGISAFELVGPEETPQAIGTLDMSEVAVVVNCLGRSIRLDQISGLQLPSMINGNTIRSLVHHKFRAHEEVLDPLGVAIPTALPDDAAQLMIFLDTYGEDDDLIIKPNSGTNSEGVQRVNKEQALAFFTEDPDRFGKQLVQVAYDFTQPFPSYVRPYDEASLKAFNSWSRAEISKEMRMYVLYSPAGAQVVPVARAIDGRDNWFFVDPDSLPEHLIKSSRDVAARTGEVGGTKTVFAAIDYGYATGFRQEAPNWHAIEINARSPYMLGYAKHSKIADHLREAFADQILAASVNVQPLC